MIKKGRMRKTKRRIFFINYGYYSVVGSKWKQKPPAEGGGYHFKYNKVLEF